jgi:hypothetical protein
MLTISKDGVMLECTNWHLPEDIEEDHKPPFPNTPKTALWIYVWIIEPNVWANKISAF